MVEKDRAHQTQLKMNRKFLLRSIAATIATPAALLCFAQAATVKVEPVKVAPVKVAPATTPKPNIVLMISPITTSVAGATRKSKRLI
jgi:hypothetical protein